MPPKPAHLDIADIVKRYEAGEPITHLARRYKCAQIRVRNALVDAGVKIRPPGEAVRASGQRRKPLDETIIRQYLAGESELALSKALGISRSAVRRRLLAAGIQPRTGSEANRLRMQRMSFAERAALAAAANDARRKDGGWISKAYQPPRSAVGIARAPKAARTREVTRSAAYPIEEQVINALKDRGVPIRVQVAVHGYNLDIAVGSIAVEVHTAAYNPARHPRFVRRAVKLAEAGWSILYVWITNAHPFTDNCADELVAHLDALHGLPPGVREERVIRGSGELAAAFRVDFDQQALVPAPIDAAQS